MSTICSAQSSGFSAKAAKTIQAIDSVYEIENFTPGAAEYDFLILGSGKLEILFMNALKSIARPNPEELKQSRTLSALASIATESWKGSQYADNKKWKQLSKYFNRAADKCTSRFNYMTEISFRVSLVDNFNKRFYYDRKSTDWELKLYSGKKPKTTLTESEEEKLERIPLKFFSEEELVYRFMKEIKRNTIKSDLTKGLYSYVGISVVIDKNTMHKNRIPTARVVVVLGARRLKNVKVKLTPDAI